MDNRINNYFDKNAYINRNINTKDNKLKNINIDVKENIDKLYKLDIQNNKDVEKTIKRIKGELQKAQEIAIKIVRGNEITKEELNFLIKKYPDIKSISEESIRDYTELIKKLEVCKTDECEQKIISNEIKKISSMLNKGEISDYNSRLKISFIKDALSISKNTKLEIKKIETLILKIISGKRLTYNEEKFINEKYLDIKLIAEDTRKEIKKIDLNFRKYRTYAEKKEFLIKEIRNLENKKSLSTNNKIKILILEKINIAYKRELKKLYIELNKNIGNKNIDEFNEELINTLKENVNGESGRNIKLMEYKNQILLNDLENFEYNFRNKVFYEEKDHIKFKNFENTRSGKNNLEKLNYLINLCPNIILDIFKNNTLIKIGLLIISIYMFCR